MYAPLYSGHWRFSWNRKGIRGTSKAVGAYYSAERNGTEHLIPQNTYFAESIEMGPKQLPSLVVII